MQKAAGGAAACRLGAADGPARYWMRCPLARIWPLGLTSIVLSSVSGPLPGTAKSPIIMRAPLA
jgi:hypothetical protein